MSPNLPKMERHALTHTHAHTFFLNGPVRSDSLTSFLPSIVHAQTYTENTENTDERKKKKKAEARQIAGTKKYRRSLARICSQIPPNYLTTSRCHIISYPNFNFTLLSLDDIPPNKDKNLISSLYFFVFNTF